MPLAGKHKSLLRAEAEQRARTITVNQMTVELDLTIGESRFASTTTIAFDFSGTDAGRDDATGVFVDFKGEELLGAWLNGKAVAAGCWRQGRIWLPSLEPCNIVRVEGLMAYSNDGEGLHRHVDPADQNTYLYAMSFLDAAPRWFACFDQPDLKAPYELRVTAPPGWTVLGNGPSECVADGRWRIRVPKPMSTYFVTVVAGPYASMFDEHEGIRLGFHVRSSLAEALQREAADLVAVTKAGFDYFHRVFGVRYPFGEYSQAFVPDFNAGAMENPGCVTLRDQYIYRARATRAERAHRAGTMIHELAHMWFGNLVTMTWWDDLWLNESFAEYMAHRACEEIGDYLQWTEFGIIGKDRGSVADQAPSTHPVAGPGSLDAESALQNFDGISYAKGAALLKQLVAHLGDKIFFSGLRRYFGAHPFSNAELDDLLAAWADAGAADLGTWSAGWLKTSGMDTIDVVRGHGTFRITSTPPGEDQQAHRTHALAVAAVRADGAVLARTAIELSTEPVEVELPLDVALVVPDATDDTWAKIRFGDGSWPVVADVLPRLSDSSARVVVINGVRDAVRNAELAPGTALQILCSSIVGERSEVVLDSVLDFARTQLAGPFSPPQLRSERRSLIHTAARKVLQDSAPGSDRQLVAFRHVIATCDDLQRLRLWLSSSKLPDGVELDSELGWALVGRIAVLSADTELVEATCRNDPSGVALSHAARARAALPTGEAKAAAWQLLMKPSSVSAYEVYATAEGFFQPSQSELTAEYARRYFSDIVDTSSFRSGWVLGRVALLSYPAAAATRESLELAEQTLTRTDLAAPLRRSLLDGTDRLRRACAGLALQAS